MQARCWSLQTLQASAAAMASLANVQMPTTVMSVAIKMRIFPPEDRRAACPTDCVSAQHLLRGEFAYF
jgi:hypothetical protein